MPRIKRYGRNKLLRLLERMCPGALAKVPPPEEFEFSTESGGVDLFLGFHTDEICDYYARREVRVVCRGEQKPKTGIERHGISCIGSLEDSLFSSLAGQGYDRWDALDVKTRSGMFAALVAFVFVYCEQKDEFADFEGGKDLKYLVAALNKMSEYFPEGETWEKTKSCPERIDRTVSEEEAEDEDEDDEEEQNIEDFDDSQENDKAMTSRIGSTEGSAAESSNNEESVNEFEGDDGDDLFIPEQPRPDSVASSKKRLLDDDEDDDRLTVKKSRAN